MGFEANLPVLKSQLMVNAMVAAVSLPLGNQFMRYFLNIALFSSAETQRKRVPVNVHWDLGKPVLHCLPALMLFSPDIEF